MGRTVAQFWDERTASSRAASPGDPRGSLFHAYVPHRVCGWAPKLPGDLWSLLAEAAEECRRLRLAAGSGSLPADWLLQRSESMASSTIEGIRPSARRVARAEAQLVLFGERPPLTEMEALRNVHVTQHARSLAERGSDLAVDDLLDLHTTLMGDDDPIAGQVRDRQNWVGAGLIGGPLEAHYVGPPPESVPALLSDLIQFMNSRSGSAPVLEAAVVHAQFETIHPFADGNGRTGRALIQYMYAQDGLAANSALPVSSALMLGKEQYFEALDAYRVICDPEDGRRSDALYPLAELLASATRHACRLHERLDAHMGALRSKWREAASAHRVRLTGTTLRLLEWLPENPVLTVSSARQSLGLSERTARAAVSRLAAAGILAQRSAGRRNRVFECVDMMDAFTEAIRAQPADNLSLLPAPDG